MIIELLIGDVNLDFILSCLLFLSALIFSVSYGIYIFFPLAFGLFCFSVMGIYRGFSLKRVLKMILDGMSKVVIVLCVFLLLGIVTAVWRACGTISFFVYYGVSLVDPEYFIFFTFVMSCLVSLFIGSSSGTAATIGVVLMLIAKSGGANVNMAAGAILAGIFFGDRCAPTSAGANLIAVITKTDLLNNIKNMLRSALMPLIISLLIYLVISFNSGMDKTDDHLLSEISANFNLGIVTIIPALVVIILPVLKCGILLSMFVSVLSGIFIAVFVQGTGLYELVNYMLTGYELESQGQFARIISGGGLISMLNSVSILMISSGYSGLFEGTGVLKDVIGFLKFCSRKIALFPITLITAVFTAAFGCTQIVSVILTHHLMRDIYREKGLNNNSIALDLEDSSVVVSPLIPWNMAAAVPMAMISAGAGCIPYAVFLYIIPLYRIFYDFPRERRLS